MITHIFSRWSTLKFGKYSGKTLPLIILSDPDYFYWAYGNGFKSHLLMEQATEIADKASRIKIPKPDLENWRIKYAIHPNGSFEDFSVLPISAVHPDNGSILFRHSLDLFMPRRLGQYDKLGYRIFLAKFREYWFDGGNLTKERCEEFFLNNENFVPTQTEAAMIRQAG